MRRRTKNRPIATENASRPSWVWHESAHDAMQHLANAFAECAVSAHVSGGAIFAKTSDGMKWVIRYEQMGVRNSKTGSIGKRIKAKWPND